jgi:ATP-binding cassette, subfamily B, bacterial
MTLNFRSFPFYKQLDSMDCGPACLLMVAKHFGKVYPLPYLREKCYIDRLGVSMKGIHEAAESIGLRTTALQISLFEEKGIPSLSTVPLPAIVHWNQNHFVVVYKISKRSVWVADPAKEKLNLSIEEFTKGYCSKGDRGYALVLEVTPDFNRDDDVEEAPKGFGFLWPYLKPHKRLVTQLLIGLLLGTIFQLIFPFLTQSLVDIGIGSHNLEFIYLVLIGQLALFLGQTIVRFIQSWIQLHVGMRINTSLIGDFIIKLLKLPLGFFDSKNTGDLLQRVDDHNRIKTFLTESLLSLVFSVITILVFGVILIIYSTTIFTIFLISSCLYLLWIFIFLQKRKKIDYKGFELLADNRNSLIEIIQGITEIKLQGSEAKRRWKWTAIQAKLLRNQVKLLELTQYQDGGALSINQLKDILITFISAKSVMDGEISLGMMLSIQYIIGSLSNPLQQLSGVMRSTQDAFISLERLSEIHNSFTPGNSLEQKIDVVPKGDLIFQNVTFRYTPLSAIILDDISFVIPRGRTTAIVGASGSGKTTLLKLMLNFYAPSEGNILIGNVPLKSIHEKVWREHCGAVMQEGFIFSDTIANNIAESDDHANFNKVVESVNKANLVDFVESFPSGLNTVIGAKGNGISQGQKQRILIARSIYKDPEFLFLDEATNSLDASNEKVIMQNLESFLKGKTSIIVAHRLSTVKNADQIIVLDKGKIVEVGTHEQLVEQRRSYFTLVQNQLELGE